MPSLREDFLRTRERLVKTIDMRFVPHPEGSRQSGFGEDVAPINEASRLLAQAALEKYAPAGGRTSAGADDGPSGSAALRALASAYAETSDEKCAQAARACYEEWLANQPTNIDHIAHGIYGWLGQLHAFLGSETFDDAFVQRIIDAVCAQLQTLSQNIYPDRNLRFTYATSLLVNGLKLSFLPQGKEWVRKAARILTDGCHRQIMPDGSHQEATPHYHYCVMGDILASFRRARTMPELRMDISAEAVASLYDYLAAATRPTGWITGINDGTYDDPASVHGNGVGDVLNERDGFRKSLGLPEKPLAPMQVFPHAGQAFLRDSWRTDATYITLDTTTCRSYHWHASRNAIQVQAFGRALIVDPGRFSYSDAAWGGYAGRTRAHTTLNLNGWDQSEGLSEMRYEGVEGYDLVVGNYEGGYWSGEGGWSSDHKEGLYARHHRTLLWIRERCIVVLDNMAHVPNAGRKPTLESVWQFSEGAVELDAKGQRAITKHDDANLLMLFALMPDGSRLSLHEGEKDPLRGWVPKRFEQEYISAPQVCLRVKDNERWRTELATVLVPYRGRTMPQVKVLKVIEPEKSGDFHHPGFGMISLKWGDGTIDEIWWMPRLAVALDDRAGTWTDASLVHVQTDSGGKLLKGVAVDGTYVEPFAPRPRKKPGMFVIG